MSGEELAENLFKISNISFVLFAIFMILAIFFFIKFHVPKVWGDLSGKNAKKSIKKMRTDNSKKATMPYRSDTANRGRGRVTATMPGAGSVYKNQEVHPETGILDENKGYNYDVKATTLLNERGGTEELHIEHEEKKKGYRVVNKGVSLKMIDDVMIINTNERI